MIIWKKVPVERKICVCYNYIQEANTRLERIVFHIDVNSAFLSWEAVHRLAHKGEKQDLREISSAVGGDIAMRHGIILAKSIPAKKYGIRTGDSILEAKRKCPNLVIVPPDYELYEKCSAAFINILKRYSDAVEQYSIDEAYVDMTESCHLFGSPEETAYQIKDSIRDRLGFTVNVGVSVNKLLAKMAGDLQKPDKVHTLYPEEIREKMWPLPVSDLFFVGRATTEKLISVGIKTIGELAAADLQWIKSILKKPGETVWNFANGIDLSPVLCEIPANKGYGNSTTMPYDVTDGETAGMVLLSLAETIGNRIRNDKVQISVVEVSIRYSDFSYFTHQTVLQNATDITWEIYQTAFKLFLELWNHKPIRHLGIYTGRVENYNFYRQQRLFDEADYGKLEKVDRTVDNIRKRFGIDSMRRATFVNQPFDHMGGGVSGEKRQKG